MLSTNTAVKAQQAKRDELAADVERYAAEGGKIQWCDSSWNVGSEADIQRLRRRSFEIRTQREQFGATWSNRA